MAKGKLNKIKVLKIMKKLKSEIDLGSSKVWFNDDQVYNIDIYGFRLRMSTTTFKRDYTINIETPEVLQEFLNAFKVFQIIKDLESFI